MPDGAPRRRFWWVRRLVTLALVVTAAGIWMDLHHVRPWAYLQPDADVPPASSALSLRITDSFHYKTADVFLQDMKSRYGAEVRFQNEARRQFDKANAGAVDIEAHGATLKSILIAGISSTGDYRFEERDGVLRIGIFWSPPLRVTEIHPVMGGFAALQMGAEPPQSQVQSTSLQGGNLLAFPGQQWGRSYRAWQMVPTYAESDFPLAGMSTPGIYGGMSAYQEDPSRHEALRQVDEQMAGGYPTSPPQLETIGRGVSAEVEAALLEEIDVDLKRVGAREAIKRLLDGKLPYLIAYADEHVLQRPVTVKLSGVSRWSALRAAVRQARLKATVGEDSIVIFSQTRAGERILAKHVFVGDLFRSGYELPRTLAGEYWHKRYGSQVVLAGNWQHLRHAHHVIAAGREALKLSEPGDLVFVGEPSAGRIEEALLQPAKPLGGPKTALELAEALRKTYGINVVLHSAHEAKSLEPLSAEASGKPLFRVLKALLPPGETGRFWVEDGALILAFGGNDNSQLSEFWVRTGAVHDPEFERVVLTLFGNRVTSNSSRDWPDSFHHNPLTQTALVSCNREELLMLREIVRLLTSPPGKSRTRLDDRLFGRKYAAPGLQPLEEITFLELATPRTKHRHPLFSVIQTPDGVVLTGNAEEHQRFEELISHWNDVTMEDPVAGMDNGDWVVRHKAALRALSEIRLLPDPESVGKYAAPLLSGEKLSSHYRTMFIRAISNLGERTPDLSEHYVEPFAKSDNPEFRNLVIDMLFRCGSGAMPQIHAITGKMSDDELATVAERLGSLPPMDHADWLPLILRIHDLHPPARERMDAMRRNIMTKERPDVDLIPLPGFRLPRR